MKTHFIIILFWALLVFPATASAQVPDPGDWVDNLAQDVEFINVIAWRFERLT